MRITGRQLRRIIQEEVARMMNEEDAVQVFKGTADEYKKRADDAAAEVDKLFGDPRRREQSELFDRLLAGEVFTDANADAYVKMTVNALIDGLSEANGMGIVSLPTSDFGANLKTVQKKLGIPADGVLGPQTYLALMTGGKIKIPANYLRKRKDLAKKIADKIKRKQDAIADINEMLAYIKSLAEPSMKQVVEDIIFTFKNPPTVPPTNATLDFLMNLSKDDAFKGLGPGIVPGTGTGTTGVKVGPSPKVGPSSTPKVLPGTKPNLGR